MKRANAFWRSSPREKPLAEKAGSEERTRPARSAFGFELLSEPALPRPPACFHLKINFNQFLIGKNLEKPMKRLIKTYKPTEAKQEAGIERGPASRRLGDALGSWLRGARCKPWRCLWPRDSSATLFLQSLPPCISAVVSRARSCQARREASLCRQREPYGRCVAKAACLPTRLTPPCLAPPPATSRRQENFADSACSRNSAFAAT